MLVNIIQNTISSFRSALAAAEVITTNLKMWLGFETSETLGREEVVNGDFATDLSSWDISGTDATHTVTYSNGSARYQSDSVTPQLNFDQTISNVEVGKIYQLSIDVTYTTGILKVSSIDSNLTALSEGLNVFNVVAATKTIRILRGANIVDALINSVSLKELTQITPDKSGNNNVGELFTGKALEFDGVNDRVVIDFTTQIKSAVFWVKPLGTGEESILGFGGVATAAKSIKSDSNNIQIAGLSSVSVYVNGVSTTSVPVNQWSRVVVNFALFTPQTLEFGYAYNSLGNIQLSDVQLYNENLSTDDIAYDYANPNKLAIDNPSTSLSVTNLKGYWALSEGDGFVAYDSGTNLEEEEVVDGDFPLPNVNWALGDGWSIANNKASNDGESGSNNLRQNSILTSSKSYQITIEVSDYVSGNVQVSAGGVPRGTMTANGMYTFTQVASGSNFFIVANSFVGSVSNVSVREVTASDHGGIINGATYVDAQPRIPQLGMMNWSKGSNLFPYSEDFTEWVINSNTSQVVLSLTEAAPYGQGDVYSIIMQSSESDAYIRYATTNATLTSSTHSVWVKQAPTGSATHIRITNNDRTAWNTGTSEKIALTSSWQRIETTDAITGNRFTIIGSADASGTQDSDCIGKALIYGAQLVEGSSAGAYRFTDGAAISNSTFIANPTTPTQDILGNAVRDRLNSFNLGKFGGARVDDFTLSGKQATFQLWFKNVNSNDGLYLADLKSATDRIVLGFNSSQLSIFHEITGSWQNFGTITDGDWNFATFTFDSTSLKCFVGTSQLGVTKTITAINIGTTTDFGIGMNYFFSDRQKDYNGHISDFLIYDRVLTSDEIENNYNAGLSAHTN